MATASELKAKIEQYQNDIDSFSHNLEVEKCGLNMTKEWRRSARGGKTGRISSTDFSLQLKLAQYDFKIAKYEANIAMYKNQIKLRKESIAEMKKELKTLKNKGA